MEGRKVRNEEKTIDTKLNVKTSGLRDFTNKHFYNRTESTPYRSLVSLFNELKLNEDDCFVDFGCGKGRVLFYLNSLYNCKIKGIEANPLTFDEAVENLETYSSNLKKYNNNISLIFQTAETYKVEKEDNVFYFFNPFSIVIFRKVIENIKRSLKKHPRKIKIIVFYTIEEYREFLNNETSFKVVSRVKTPNQSDRYQQFLIYEN